VNSNGTVASVLSVFARAVEGADSGQCVINLGGVEINTASFAMYTFSLGVLVQALALVSFSSMADYGMNLRTEFGNNG